MNLDDLKTFSGLTLKELAVKFDEQLPPDAYKEVPGGAGLTDIDPGYMKQVLNIVFGLCGIGWGYHYDPNDLKVEVGVKSTSKGDKPAVYATLAQLTFWYKLVGTDPTQELTITIPASGASDNSNAAYAMKGAVTSAIGNAVSLIGFQESVYLGKRDHNTVRRGKATGATSRPGASTRAGATALSKPQISTCRVHNTPMRQYQGKTGPFFAHKIGPGKDDWCYGEATEKKAA